MKSKLKGEERERVARQQGFDSSKCKHPTYDTWKKFVKVWRNSGGVAKEMCPNCKMPIWE